MDVVSYLVLLREALAGVDSAAVARLAAAVRQTGESGGTIYTLGNGGSASTASHLALDLAKNTRRADRRHLRVVALVDNVGLITAWANDSRYDEVFAAQLDGIVR